MGKTTQQYLLVEPVAKTPYPPLGLMRIGTMLRRRHDNCQVMDIVGTQAPSGIDKPTGIYVTSLFTWDLKKVVRCVQFYAEQFPAVPISLGGIAASLLPDYIEEGTGVRPHVGLFEDAECCPPDYSLTFGRRVDASITFASRGCPRHCRFCCVRQHEPKFFVRDDWEKDICLKLPKIIFWDNNWLASPNFRKDCDTIRRLGKPVDFNQGLDARLYNKAIARELSDLRVDPIRFAFDSLADEPDVLRAIRLAKKYSNKEVRVYVLYNYQDTPEDLFYRIDLLNRNGALVFPMEYRKPVPSDKRLAGPNWNVALLRAFKLTLIFYYHRGMITESRRSFKSIYGTTAGEFVSKLYEIYDYDRALKR